MNYLHKEQVKNAHEDLFVKDFVEFIYNNPQPKEKDLQKYALYFVVNEHLLDGLLDTIDDVLAGYKF
jgi:hypothetical protein